MLQRVWHTLRTHLEKRSTLIVFLSFVYYIGARLSLIYRYGYAAFGYDTGIYRHALQDYLISGASLPAVGGFMWFAKPLLTLGVSTDGILYGLYIGVGAVFFYLFYQVILTYFERMTAVWAAILLTFSSVQFSFFWWYYYRNVLALVFICLFLLFAHRRSYWAILPLAATGIIHSLSLVPVGLTMIVMLYRREMRRYLVLVGTLALALIIAVAWREVWGYTELFLHIGGRAENAGERARELTGQFLSGIQFARSMAIYGILGALGLLYSWRKNAVLIIFTGINYLLIVVGFVLYRRFFVFLDLVFITLAAQLLASLTPMLLERWIGRIALGVFLATIIILSFLQVQHQRPIINPREIDYISALDALPPSLVISYRAQYAPWVYGFSAQTIIAPGLFEANRWNHNEWRIFWNSASSDDRVQLLQRYGTSTLYIYTALDEQPTALVFSRDPGVTRLTPTIWRYEL